MSITKSQNIDLSAFTFSEPKVDQNTKAKRIFVNSKGGKIVIQTPKMYVPNGVTRWRKPDAIDNKDDSFELELSFGGESPDVQKFHEIMNDYDKIVKDNIQKNSLSWIGKQKASMETIEDAFYIPTVKLAVDKNKERVDYPDRMKVKIDRQRSGDDFTGEFVSNKKFNTKILAFDENKESLKFNEDTYDKIIPKGCHIVCILELVFIFCSKQVSTKWKLVQFKVFRGNASINTYAIDDSEEVENDEHIEETEAEHTVPTETTEAVEEAEAAEAESLAKKVEDLNWADSVDEEVPVATVKKGSRKRKEPL